MPRFQAFIIFKSNDFLKIHFRGWTRKWDEDVGVPKFESRLRPRNEGTAVGAELFFETFDEVAGAYGCSKFRFCEHTNEEAPPMIRSSAESPGTFDTVLPAAAGISCHCEEIDACDAAGQWYFP
jgi:hypothetical protein